MLTFRPRPSRRRGEARTPFTKQLTRPKPASGEDVCQDEQGFGGGEGGGKLDGALGDESKVVSRERCPSWSRTQFN